MKKSREVPKTNYILFILMILTVILVVFFISRLYKNSVNEMKEIPIIRDSLNEINSTEVDHYIIENPSTLLYICKPSDDVCRNFEKKFKSYIVKNNLTEYMTYVNLNHEDAFEFFDKFNAKYAPKEEISIYYPVVILFDDGEIKAYIQGKKDKPLTVSDVKYFLKMHDIGEISE